MDRFSVDVHNEQENRVPHMSPNASPMTKEVRTPAMSPTRPTKENGVAFPVKNTFIHYGSPCARTPTRVLATPKTVPHNFAPEVAAEMRHGSLQQTAQMTPVPDWPGKLQEQLPPLPIHQDQNTQVSHACYQVSQSVLQVPQNMPLQAPQHLAPQQPSPQPPQHSPSSGAPAARSSSAAASGVAPLRLFDFLPSPKIQQPDPVPAAQLQPVPPPPFFPPQLPSQQPVVPQAQHVQQVQAQSAAGMQQVVWGAQPPQPQAHQMAGHVPYGGSAPYAMPYSQVAWQPAAGQQGAYVPPPPPLPPFVQA
eukprot:TRINITY_DN94820_c0_g1_i1.p1 TRINITY_DN94820_c0_g1~~TRINITY_DN94820_c0_g1_i1.p1  ORF type:complete len:306 (+),score=70.54 TRINITY_DN94820_c0_g1_i1:114-1031(+)